MPELRELLNRHKDKYVLIIYGDTMSTFSLLQELGKPPEEPEASLLPEGIDYDEYVVKTIDVGEKIVYIPVRAAGGFEEALSEYNTIVYAELKQLLREHRGIGKV